MRGLHLRIKDFVFVNCLMLSFRFLVSDSAYIFSRPPKILLYELIKPVTRDYPL